METVSFGEALVLGRSHEELWSGHNVYLVRSVSRPELGVMCDSKACDYVLRIDAFEGDT